MSRKFVQIQVSALGLVLAILSVGCTKKSSTSNRGGAEAPPPTDTIVIDAGDTEPPVVPSTIDLTASLPVSGNITSSTEGVNTLAISASLLSTSVNCESGSFVVRAIGGGVGNKIGDAIDFSDSKFSISEAKVDNELALEFTCDEGGTLRCLTKAGDNGVLCNAIADSVLSAFEVALGKTIYDSSFKGANISRLASSIVDASKIDSDEVAIFKEQITACGLIAASNAKKNCYADAIEKSPFVGPFHMMKHVALGFDVEGLVVLVTDVLGLELNLEASELYDDLNDMLDDALGIDFFADLRTLLHNAVVAQRDNLGTYPFVIKCKLDVQGDTKYFDPDVASNGHIECDRTQATALLTAEGISGSDITTILNDSHGSQVACSSPNANAGQCYVSYEMIATAAAAESDRNDINGTRNQSSLRFRVSLIDVMPQVMQAISASGVPMGNDGPDPQNPAQVAKLKQAVSETKDFFLGLAGVYRFLNDANLRKVKLSLNDLHNTFTGDAFMRARLVAYGPSTRYAQIKDGSNNRGHFPPIMTYNGALKGYRLLPEFLSSSPGQYNFDMTIAEAKDVYSRASVPFSETFEMFTDLPDSHEIDAFVSNSSHHEEWNPIGQKYIYTAQFGSSGKPITCHMDDAGINFRLEANTKVVCSSDYSNVTCDTDGKCTFPSNYADPFILFERGWYGDGIGRLFALGSRSSGMEIGRGGNGRGVLVREYSINNPTGQCNAPAQKNKVVTYQDEFWCSDSKRCTETIQAYCLDMSTLGTPARRRFFPGGNYTVRGYDSFSGRTWEWNVPQIGVYDSNVGHSKDYAGCLEVASNFFITSNDANRGSNKATLNVDGTGFVTTTNFGTASAAIISCDSSAGNGKEKFRLYQFRDFDGADTMYAYLLDSQDRTLQWKDQPGNGEVWEDTYLKFKVDDIHGLLTAKTVAGSASTQINSMRYVNPRHDPKFDPYCDDLNGNGACDCYPLASLSADRKTATYGSTLRSNPAECGLGDKTAEPTVSQLPYCPDCMGSSAAISFFNNFAGKGGSELRTSSGATTENDIQLFMSSLSNGMPMDMQQAFACKYIKTGESLPRQPSSINFGQFEGDHPGCPDSSGVITTGGPIRVMSFKPMRNAYDIGKPNTLIKLYNYATKSIGQGHELKPDEDAFAPDEAIALLILRLMLKPQNIKLYAPTGSTQYRNFSAGFEPLDNPENDRISAFSSIFKSIMYKAKRYTLEDVLMQGNN